MAERLKMMITDYKNTGSRVDEVLFQEVMKVVKDLEMRRQVTAITNDIVLNYVKELIAERNDAREDCWRALLLGEWLHDENRRLLEAIKS